MRTRSLLVAVAVAALAGCSLSLKTDKLDPLKTPEGFCQTLFSEVLSKVESCKGATQPWVDAQYAQISAMCSSISEARGTFTYDEGAARQVIDQMRSADCDTFDQLMNGSDSPLVGNVGDYGPCRDSYECADSSAQCYYADGSCPGRCLPPGGTGEPCYNGYPDCAPGNYCKWNGSNYTCAPTIPVNYDCSSDTNACESGSYCSSTYVCTAFQPLGWYCDGTGQYNCDSNAYPPAACDSAVCVQTGYVGEKCAYGSWCLDGYCDLLGSCVAYRAEGATCTSDQQCGQLRCIGALDGTVSSGVCGRARGLGQPCVAGANDCAEGAYCVAPASGVGGVCTSWSLVGGPCGRINGEIAQCFGGYCPSYMGGPAYLCAAFLPLGTYCGGSQGDDPCGPRGFFEGAARCSDWTSGYCVAACWAQ